MPTKVSKTGSELFIVDNSDQDWKVLRYLHDWCQLSSRIDIATGYFEIGALLGLKDEWQKVDKIRVLMGDEVSKRTKNAFAEALETMRKKLDHSIEKEKEKNDFLTGVPAIVEGIRSGKIECKVYRKEKFHAKAYITHARQEVVGAFALVGSSNLTFPGLTENVELNVQITGRPVSVLQEWYDEHWKEAEDVTPEILKVIERHTDLYTPFEVYAKSLQEYIEHYEMDDADWEHNQSALYSKVLATYQRNGYHGLLKRANKYGGAFLCDGVGLGKTFIGLMLIERLVKRDKKRVVLFVPKVARESVWESKIHKYMPEILGGFMSFRIFNHTDLLRPNLAIQRELRQMTEQADVVIIDEAHHFRNRGTKGEEDQGPQSRYWAMYDLCENKQVFMLTATPVNNRLTDLQHMMELFSRQRTDYFSLPPLGIHSLSGHIRQLEKAIERAMDKRESVLGGDGSQIGLMTLAEAAEILRNDLLFEETVVQRSRAYVKKSLKQEDKEVLFPEPCKPEVVPYSVKQTYGKLLKMVEDAFRRDKALFSLAPYSPYEYYTGPKEDLKEQKIAWVAGRQKQVVALIRTAFLKRFESSVHAFEASCRTLMKKLIAFYYTQAAGPRDLERLEKWLRRNKSITGLDPDKRAALFDDIRIEMQEEDVVEAEFFENAAEQGKLDGKKFDIEKMVDDTLDDLETLGMFLRELANFEPKHDKKLLALIKLLKNDPILSKHKCLIFSEFKDTACYLEEQLAKAEIDGVMEIDSGESSAGRANIIRAFAPYYNDSSSTGLAAEKLEEKRILISTDVLSEGLNLQDATRLINYDLHWNPVRLMQRIGRIDRRLDKETEAAIVRDHPDQADIRKKIQYYNFLPPEELNELLDIYKRVTHKTLRISKTFGIENGRLLRPDDDYDVLKDFISQCEGSESMTESLSLEYQRLLAENPGLAERLADLPGKVFSGKETPSEKAIGVFFCYARPGKDVTTDEWSLEKGDSQWYLYNLEDGRIVEEATAIAAVIRCEPKTPRKCRLEKGKLSEIRTAVDKHIKNTYLKKVQAPIGVAPRLIAWLEIS